MGIRFFGRNGHDSATATSTDRVGERFNAHFPRLFAYVRACVGGEITTQDICVKAFSQAFGEAGAGDDYAFRTALFRAARSMARPALKDNRASDSLAPREREVLALVFDAGFTRREIADMFRFRESTVSSLLMSGLRKLKEETSPAVATAYASVT
jgi:DNA-directed RNA polymerase specialized sigma24 family protein